jgi:hypothetical protein
VTPSEPVVAVQVRCVIWFSGTFGANDAGVQYGCCWLVSATAALVHDGTGSGTVRPYLFAHTTAVAVDDVPTRGLVEAKSVMSSRELAGCCTTVRTSA